MNDELAPLPKIDQLVQRYRGMREDEWNRCIAKLMSTEASCIIEAAAMIRAREEDGVDMSAFKERNIEWFDTIRKFAYGQAIPALVVFSRDRPLVKLLANLTHPDQERVASGESFPVLEISADGQFACYKRTADRMTFAQRRLVFGGGTIRNEQEQRDILSGRQTAAMRRTAPSKIAAGTMDYERVGGDLPKGFYPLEVLDQMVRALRRFGRK